VRADITTDCYNATRENPASNEKIISLCTQAIRATQGSTRAASLHNRGIGYMQSGELDKALADFDESIRLNPKDLWARSTRANLFRMKRLYDRALSELNEIIRLDPQAIGAYYDRGVVHRDRGDRESALTDFRTVLNMKGKDPAVENWAKARAREELEKLGKK
jgi:tetratricopeptide (TPR) repeat protein